MARWGWSEVPEVVSVLPGGVEADDEVDGGVSSGDAEQALAEQFIAGGRLSESQFVGGDLQVVAQKAGVVAVARGIDADAEAGGRRKDGRGREHGVSPTRMRKGIRTRESFAGVGW